MVLLVDGPGRERNSVWVWRTLRNTRRRVDRRSRSGFVGCRGGRYLGSYIRRACCYVWRTSLTLDYSFFLVVVVVNGRSKTDWFILSARICFEHTQFYGRLSRIRFL